MTLSYTFEENSVGHTFELRKLKVDLKSLVMKKVIFCLLIPIIFQQCTDELQEIDGVVES